MRRTALFIFLAALPAFAQQTAPQVRLPRVSPDQTLKQAVGVTDVTITYSRPGVRNRQIWGALVPYGQVWRTGANEATTITFSDDVTINGQALPKGSYSLHTIPGKDEWTLIFNKTAKQWGSYSYDAAADALRVKAKPEASPYHEWLTFDFPQLSQDQATVAIRWEKLAVPFTVGTNTTQKVLADLRAAVAAAPADDWRTAYNGATFAFDNSITGDEGASWLDRSLKANENVRNLYLKASVQAKKGDRAGAIATAEKAIAKATPQDTDLVNEIRKSMDGWKK